MASERHFKSKNKFWGQRGQTFSINLEWDSQKKKKGRKRVMKPYHFGIYNNFYIDT